MTKKYEESIKVYNELEKAVLRSGRAFNFKDVNIDYIEDEWFIIEGRTLLNRIKSLFR